MEICCIHQFFLEYKKLLKNNSYSDIEKIIIDEFINSDIDTIKSNSVRLNGSSDKLFLKKRLKGSAGYRVYYLMIIVDSKVFLAFLHPKTGSMGISNIGPNFQTDTLKEVVKCSKNGNYYHLIFENGVLNFKQNVIEAS